MSTREKLIKARLGMLALAGLPQSGYLPLALLRNQGSLREVRG